MPVTTRLQKTKSNVSSNSSPNDVNDRSVLVSVPERVSSPEPTPSIEQQIIEHLARKPNPDDFMEKSSDGDIHWCPSWNTCCINSFQHDLYKLRLEEWELHYGALLLMSMKNKKNYTTPKQPIKIDKKRCGGKKCKGKVLV